MSSEVGRNDRCPCGSRRKYKKCHGRPAIPGAQSPNSARDGIKAATPLDPELVTLGTLILDALDDTAAAIKTDPANRNDRFRKICAYHFAFLIHGVTKAALDLAQAGSRWPIFALRRLIFEYFLKAFYFEQNPDEAVLYVASVPLVQRRLAEQWASLDKTRDFSERLKLQDKIVQQMLREYPDLLRPKAKKTDTDEGDLVEWEPKKLLPLAIEYFKAEFKRHPEMVEYTLKRYALPTGTTEDEAAEVFAREKWLMNAHYPSQQIHATALSLVPTLSLERHGGFARFADHFDNPNPLVWGCLGFALGTAEMVARIGGFDIATAIEPLRSKLDAIGDRLGIE